MGDPKNERDELGFLTDMGAALHALDDEGCDCETPTEKSCLVCLCKQALKAERERAIKAEHRDAVRWPQVVRAYMLEKEWAKEAEDCRYMEQAGEGRRKILDAEAVMQYEPTLEGMEKALKVEVGE